MKKLFTPNLEGVTYRDHTADLWVEVRGKNTAEVIERFVNGIYGVIGSSFLLRGEGSCEEIAGSGPDIETAIVEVLSEVLYMLDAGPYVLAETIEIQVETDKQYIIKIRGRWYEYEIADEARGMEVKAITYHGVEIKKDNGSIIARVLVDI